MEINCINTLRSLNGGYNWLDRFDIGKASFFYLEIMNIVLKN